MRAFLTMEGSVMHDFLLYVAARALFGGGYLLGAFLNNPDRRP